MSWKTINELLGRATIDRRFAQKLLANPLQAALEGGFDLTPQEQAVLRDVKANDLAELSQILLARLKGDGSPD